MLSFINNPEKTTKKSGTAQVAKLNRIEGIEWEVGRTPDIHLLACFKVASCQYYEHYTPLYYNVDKMQMW